MPTPAILLGVAEALASHQGPAAGEILFVFQPAEEGPPDGEEGGAEDDAGQACSDRLQATGGLRPACVQHAQRRPGRLAQRAGDGGIGPLQHRRPGPADARLAAVGRRGPDRCVGRPGRHRADHRQPRQDISRLPVVLSFGAIKGGIRYNIIPDAVELVGTIRTFDEGMRQAVFADLKNVAESVAKAHGATAVVKRAGHQGQPGHRQRSRAHGARGTQPAQGGGRRQRGRDGPGHGRRGLQFLRARSAGFFFFVGATPSGRTRSQAPSNHSPEFFLDEEALKVGSRALLAVATDYLAVSKAK
jgi:metal-dependent amidase/aminoacylase/carboxypeptidase family protein